jgi:hypothetical protein
LRQFRIKLHGVISGFGSDSVRAGLQVRVPSFPVASVFITNAASPQA